MITLPNECLSEIFAHIPVNIQYRKNLFSCLLVNRQWCRNAVPVLWKEILQSNIKPSLLKIYLASLNKEEQTLLIPFQISLPTIQKPLFDYASYTTLIKISYLRNGIIEWLRYSNYNPTNENSAIIQAISHSLISMFIRTSKNLKEMLIPDDNELTMFPSAKSFVNYKPGLSQLVKLECLLYAHDYFNISITLEFIKALSTICTNLREIYFSFKSSNPSDELITSCSNIIKAQKKLRSLHINQALGNTGKLIMALDQKPFLKYLKFIKVDFSTISSFDIKALSRCKNLELLEFIHCKGITLDHCASLSNNSLDNLKELKLLSECFESSIVNSLVEMWGSTLERLYLDQIKTYELSNTLINRCSNLKYLHVYIKDEYEFLLPFLSQSSLQHFTMTSYHTDNFSYNLGQNLPTTLKCLELKKCSLASESFDKLLKNCNHLVKLEKLAIGNDQPKLEHYITLREFIKSRESLKEIIFHYKTFFIDVSMEEKIKGIIKEITNRGVACSYFGYEDKSDDY
ncbi:hypothetical protein C2G38_2052739 [Gigaspora rosea]|uniref:F-box domain-containing protein n=1 Tax=Gigaspora rosea TaxID=44941 RepID=A0A397W8V6_9GLOM|nr:hypothetical protein C2G38_2052739 [Gigaspora rosea]